MQRYIFQLEQMSGGIQKIAKACFFSFKRGIH